MTHICELLLIGLSAVAQMITTIWAVCALARLHPQPRHKNDLTAFLEELNR